MSSRSIANRKIQDRDLVLTNRFISHIFKNDYKHAETENIKKLYNCDFEILIYKSVPSKKINTIVIDKRAGKDVVYNTLEIAERALAL